MSPESGHDPSLVLSYLGLRKAIGVIGTALPFTLALGGLLSGERGLQSSVSSYYYTTMRDVLVGSLCAIGVFLLTYRGYERIDDLAGNLACVFAVGVALCPTTPARDPTPVEAAIGTLHLVFATALFLTLAFFSLVLFRKTAPNLAPTRRKLHRNVVYTVCGYTILACIALIPAVSLLGESSALRSLEPVFWLEAGAVVAFGISWITKGEAILGDEEP